MKLAKNVLIVISDVSAVYLRTKNELSWLQIQKVKRHKSPSSMQSSHLPPCLQISCLVYGIVNNKLVSFLLVDNIFEEKRAVGFCKLL